MTPEQRNTLEDFCIMWAESEWAVVAAIRAALSEIDALRAPEKRCGTCRFWNRREGRTSGDCRFVITVPVALRAAGGHWCFTFESDGANCPTWAAKENYG